MSFFVIFLSEAPQFLGEAPQFLPNLLTFGTFWAQGEHGDVTCGTRFWKFSYSECIIEFPTPKFV